MASMGLPTRGGAATSRRTLSHYYFLDALKAGRKYGADKLYPS